MHQVYISGPLTGVVDPDRVKGFYEAVGELCSDVGLEVYIPHLNTDPINNPDITPGEVFRVDKQQVMMSDTVIAYVGIPSLGVGMELAYAEVSGIPVILLYEETKRISRFPRGMPNLHAEILFRDYEHALDQLRTTLMRLPGQDTEGCQVSPSDELH